jgi:hypothetical protein
MYLRLYQNLVQTTRLWNNLVLSTINVKRLESQIM